MALLTNNFRRFPLLHCGVHPHCLFWNMTVYFCFISEFSQLLFYLFLFGCLPLSILGFCISSSGLFLHILTGWLKNLNSVRSVIVLFSSTVWISLLLRREGFLTDWWDCYVLFLFDFCWILHFFFLYFLFVAKGMYSSLIYCQKRCVSRLTPFPIWCLSHQLWLVFSMLVYRCTVVGIIFVLFCLRFWCPSIHSQCCISRFLPIPKPDFLWKGTLLEFGWVFHDKQFGGCVILCTAKGMGHA